MIGWCILALILFIAYKLFLTGSDDSAEELTALEIQDFTPHTLQKYNGKDDPRILIALRGKVYDVTAGKNHYGPEGPYSAFAGRDASRALAKHSFEPEMLTPVNLPIDTLEDLDDAEVKALDQWIEFMATKYPYCGDLKNAK